MKVLRALNQALHDCLGGNDQVFFLGEDILDPYGGAFKLAEGLSTAFPNRVVTTPVSEAGIVGLGIGMALRGLRPVVEIMFGDFVTLAADQLINHAAKLRWMSNDQVRVPLVVRTPMGGRRGYGPTHSQTLEKLYLGVPGLRVVAVTAIDAPGELLKTAVLEDDDPVVFIEHKLLYGLPVLAMGSDPDFDIERLRRDYPAYRVRLRGAPPPQLTLASYGHMAELGRQSMRRLAYEREIFAEMVVFTQLSPPQLGPLFDALAATHRLLTMEEATLTHGWGAEVAARAVERFGPGLRLRRVAAVDLPVPAAGRLEEAVLPRVDDIIAAAVEVAV